MQTAFASWIGRGLIALILIVACAGLIFIYRPAKPANANMAMSTGQFDIAAQFYAQSVESGDLRAANSLGNLYYLGLGIEKNYTLASQLYFDAARAGIAEAQLNLGHLFKLGLGVESDPMRAFAWYNMADIHGSPEAELYLTQITQEWTLSPMQISTALSKWSKLEHLINEGL